MVITKKITQTNAVIPFIAALPFEILIEEVEQSIDSIIGIEYNPVKQLSSFDARHSTCRCDESVGWLTSKSDTKKDD